MLCESSCLLLVVLRGEDVVERGNGNLRGAAVVDVARTFGASDLQLQGEALVGAGLRVLEREVELVELVGLGQHRLRGRRRRARAERDVRVAALAGQRGGDRLVADAADRDADV